MHGRGVCGEWTHICAHVLIRFSCVQLLATLCTSLLSRLQAPLLRFSMQEY